MKVVEIKHGGEMDELTVNKKNLLKTLAKISDSQGTTDLRLLYTWSLDGICTLCYGWYDGGHELENKHDLPPGGISEFLEDDSSTMLLFGSLFILRKQDKSYIDVDVSDYSLFYSVCFCGYDCSDESAEDEQAEDDVDFIEDDIAVDDIEEDDTLDYEPDNDSGCELDTDENEYNE